MARAIPAAIERGLATPTIKTHFNSEASINGSEGYCRFQKQVD